MVASLQIIFSMIGKMVSMFRIIFSFEKNMVAGIKNTFCLLQAIFSMSETSVAASKKNGRLPEKIGLLLMILGKTGSVLYFLKTWLGTRCPLLSEIDKNGGVNLSRSFEGGQKLSVEYAFTFS